MEVLVSLLALQRNTDTRQLDICTLRSRNLE